MRYWVAGCSVGEDLWKYRKGSSTVTCDARGRWLESAHGALVWPDYLDAADVDMIVRRRRRARVAAVRARVVR